MFEICTEGVHVLFEIYTEGVHVLFETYTEGVNVLSSQSNVVHRSAKQNISSYRVNQKVGRGSGIRSKVVSHNVMGRLKKRNSI